MTCTTFSRLNYYSSDICVSRLANISLQEYITALPSYCGIYHRTGCKECVGLLQVANSVLENGYVKLSEAFRSAFPHLTYQTNSAKKKLLKMPVVALRVGSPSSGFSETYLIEHHPNFDHNHSLKIFCQLHEKERSKKVGLSKSELHDLLKLAQSDRERECVRYAAWKASGISASSARKQFSFDNIAKRGNKIHACIQEIKEITKDVEEICKVKETAMLTSLGLISSSDEESEPCSDGSVSELETASLAPLHASIPDDDALLQFLQGCNGNWFQFVSEIEENSSVVDPTVLEDIYDRLLPKVSSEEKELITQSHSAFMQVHNQELPSQQREVDALNGLIVSESEVEDPDTYLPRTWCT